MSDDYVKAAPLCEKHQPNGGTRGMCVICAGESLQHALSRISYACEPPNEMQYSSFDVHMDETAVVAQVVAQAERIRVLREALKWRLIGYPMIATRLMDGRRCAPHEATR